ncbi:MAG: hypothetical protein JF619_22200 [Massilia sp.]|nr:hypothetical protein [Massilia sp.]
MSFKVGNGKYAAQGAQFGAVDGGQTDQQRFALGQQVHFDTAPVLGIRAALDQFGNGIPTGRRNRTWTAGVIRLSRICAIGVVGFGNQIIYHNVILF